ncbi:alpha/beta hydrolase [Histomonas meleagridis]|uniref:alpha/beta hydrolase n=1 Tax=Histomonas meleagridis TaxID=135588 RepID=UPI00355970F3|nr:alpha/beta hydrolase [Histomonas meleagridis]KAH0796216.1 alpha/beta hydrolase [Histomonas meleagridis]
MEFVDTPQFFLPSQNGKIHYRDFRRENAPVVCLLPGFTMPSNLYCPLANELMNNGFSVLVIDYWGRGFSEHPNDGNFGLSSYITEVLSLLSYLQVKKCHLIGFSYGAVVAAGLVSKSPELIDKMIFISPLFSSNSPSPLQKFTLGTRFLGPLVLKFTYSLTIPEQISQQFYSPTSCEEIVKSVANVCMKQFQTSWSNTCAISKSIASYDQNEIDQTITVLANVNKRMMVILGDHDNLMDIDDSKDWWSKWVPNSEIAISEESGHLLFLEKQKETIDKILPFLNA